MKISVILCTHNPREDYLHRTLSALEAQTFPSGEWELLLVDNASTEALTGRFPLEWHPTARLVREDELGLTAARRRGIAEAAGSVLVFVDDDNVLAQDYLAEAWRIAEIYTRLGVWGAGRIEPEFEVEPAEELRRFVHMLALRDQKTAHWSNELKYNPGTPYGAGLCCRCEVARAWAAALRDSPARRALGRRGTSLASSEDIDIALTACTMELGAGVFPSLQIRHLIPARRVEEEYLLQLAEERIRSSLMLHAFYGHQPPRQPSLAQRLRVAFYYLGLTPLRRKFHRAETRGRRRAVAELKGNP